MGGRANRPDVDKQEFADREVWIQEVSDARLARYERMIAGSGREERIDGAARMHGTQEYFRDLVQRERQRRGR